MKQKWRELLNKLNEYYKTIDGMKEEKYGRKDLKKIILGLVVPVIGIVSMYATHKMDTYSFFIGEILWFATVLMLGFIFVYVVVTICHTFSKKITKIITKKIKYMLWIIAWLFGTVVLGFLFIVSCFAYALDLEMVYKQFTVFAFAIVFSLMALLVVSPIITRMIYHFEWEEEPSGYFLLFGSILLVGKIMHFFMIKLFCKMFKAIGCEERITFETRRVLYIIILMYMCYLFGTELHQEEMYRQLINLFTVYILYGAIVDGIRTKKV